MNRVLALPPARKSKQGNDTMDKCAPYHWARAQSRPSNVEIIKSILMLSIMCMFLKHRNSPDTPTKLTRATRVIYSTSHDSKKTKQNKTNLHHDVFINTKPWDSHPTASHEGDGTTHFVGYHRYHKSGPLGAAMRLTYGLAQDPQTYSQAPNEYHAPKKETKTPMSS